MENAYATSLWKVIEKGMKPTDAVQAVHAKLKSEGREALLPRIASAFGRLAEQMRGRHALTLTVADSAHVHSAQKEAAAYGLEIKDAKTHIDSTLIGGWRLEGRENLVDASYKKHLLAIYRATTHS